MAIITSPTVYDCGSCGRPIAHVTAGWRHMDRTPACHEEPVAVHLPLPTLRTTAGVS